MEKMMLGAKEIALYGVLGCLMYAAKMAMAALPNIEPVSLLVMVYTAALGRRALYPIYTYVGLEYCVWGINLWSINYLYVWLILYCASIACAGMRSRIGWAALSGVFGACFGLLCTPVYAVSGGVSFAISWWVSGIPFDLLHCIGNFAMAFALFPAQIGNWCRDGMHGGMKHEP